MKKRIVTFFLSIVMLCSLTPTTFAAVSAAPYSLPYLEGIDGANYIKCVDYEDTELDSVTITQNSLEMYDVFEIMIGNNFSWSDTISHFKKAFQSAGFSESITIDSYGQETYSYILNNDVFSIYGEKASQAVLNESGLVCIQHGCFVSKNTEDAAIPGLDNFKQVNTYTTGQFQDIPSGAWYADNVKNAYEYGLMKGNSNTTFNPTGNVTIAETLALACRLHNIYTGGTGEFNQGDPWYQVYVDYAASEGIISGSYAYTASATRAQFASILANAMPSNALPSINNIEKGAIPDVSTSSTYANAVYMLYRSGILTGSDEYGTFNPDSNIQRSEVATIVTRMAVDDVRKTFTLKVKPIDYSYLAASDFRSIRRDYSHAVARHGYALEFTDLNGDKCVLTYVRWKIVSDYTTVTLHNLTKGTTVSDPIEYYKDRIDRSYGATKLKYYDLYEEFLRHYQTSLEAVQSVLKNGVNTANGSFVSAEYLNQ